MFILGDLMFKIVPLMILIIAGVIVFRIIQSLKEWSSNNKKPIQSINAKVVSKRTEVWGARNNHHASTSYYVTFQIENGERMEFRISGKEYGKLVEEDKGNLTFQGTRYHKFNREI